MLPVCIAAACIVQGAQAFPLPDKILSAPDAKTVVARVNGKEITAGDVQKLLWDWDSYAITQELMVAALVEDAAAKAGVSTTKEEVEKIVADNLEAAKRDMEPGRTIEDHIRMSGMPMSRLLLRARIEALVMNIAMRDFHPEELRRISRLLIVPTTLDEAGQADAKKRIAEAEAKLKKGESWQVVVRSMSNDVQSRENDGLVGWVVPGVQAENVKNALLKAKPGEITEVIENGGTYAIFRIEASGAPTPEDLQKIKDQYLGTAMTRVYQEIQQKAVMENLLVPPVKR